MASFAITQVGVRLQWLGGTVRPTGRQSEVTGKPIRCLLIPFKDSPLRRRSLASLNFPEEEVMVLEDVASGRAVLARVRERKRRRWAIRGKGGAAGFATVVKTESNKLREKWKRREIINWQSI